MKILKISVGLGKANSLYGYNSDIIYRYDSVKCKMALIINLEQGI